MPGLIVGADNKPEDKVNTGLCRFGFPARETGSK